MSEQEITQFIDGRLAQIPKADDIFLVQEGVKPIYEAVIEKLHADVIGLDPTKKKDQKAIRSIAMDGRKSKTFIDKIGAEVKKKYLAPAENIDPNRREAKHNIDKAIDEILAPVIAEEQKVERKAQDLKDAMDCFESIAVKEIGEVALSSDQLKAMMVELNETTIETLSEKYDIEGEELKINCTKMACAKRLQSYIAERVNYEAGQAKLAAVAIKEEAGIAVDAHIATLRGIAKFADGLTVDSYIALIDAMEQQVIDERYGDRKEEAMDIRDLCLMKLEKAKAGAKAPEPVEPTLDDAAIDAELARWASLTQAYLADGVSPEKLKGAIEALSSKVLEESFFMVRLTEAKTIKVDLVAMMILRLEKVVTEPEFEELPIVEPPVCDIGDEVADIISGIIGCDLSDSLLVVESIENGKLADYLEFI